MSIEITGRHIEVPSRDKEWVYDRINRLERHTGRIDEARLVVTGERHRILAEATVACGRLSWKAHEENVDISSALASVIDKIEAQAKKVRARGKTHKGKTPVRKVASEWEVEVLAAEGFRSSPHERRIVKTSRIPIKPMSVEEAALELDDSDHEFIVFHDSGSDRTSVLYKRHDGDLGLIVPEW
jgi:putative sigma-54 modulation protein